MWKPETFSRNEQYLHAEFFNEGDGVDVILRCFIYVTAFVGGKTTRQITIQSRVFLYYIFSNRSGDFRGDILLMETGLK